MNPTSPLPQDKGVSQGWKPDHRPAALTCPEYLEAHSSVSISPCSGYSALWTEGSHVQTAGTLAAPKESLETREGQSAISRSLAVVEATSTGSLSHRLPASLEVSNYFPPGGRRQEGLKTLKQERP